MPKLKLQLKKWRKMKFKDFADTP